MARALEMVHERDPKEELLTELGPAAAKMEVMGARVLVAVYVRPSRAKLAGGAIIELADRTRDEDKYQGKIGLILQKGPLAFVDDAQHKWGDRTPEVGEWVQFSVYETKPFEMRRVSGREEIGRCRFVEDVDIHAIAAEPDLVW